MPEILRPHKPRGVVTINAELCKGCGFCIEFCPAKVLKFSIDFNSKGYHPPWAAKPEACTGCDLCGMYCPDFAIFGTLNKSVA
jgi:2-oxoglutarate ferredoxin oxidoreductase subunit delta